MKYKKREKKELSRCKICGNNKPKDEFYLDHRYRNGHGSWCKRCVSEYQKNWYLENKSKILDKQHKYGRTDKGKKVMKETLARMSRKYPEKFKARWTVRDALKSGKLEKRPCLICGDVNSEAHHHDYTKSLDVSWLCMKHHRQLEKGELSQLLHDFSEELIGKDEKVNPLHGNCEVCTPKCARNQFRAERREKRDKLLGMKK